MIEVVVIGRDEAESIKPMYKSLKKLLPESNRIWILDRCKDDSAEILDRLGEDYFKRTIFHNGFGRKTSSNRNFGLEMTSDGSDVLFLDADRYVVKGGLKNLEKSKYDITLLRLENDTREENYKVYEGKITNGFYSCGIFFKSDAIDKIIEFQGELFSTEVEKDWGSEDLYLGDVCHHLGLSIGFYNGCMLHGSFERKLPKKFDSLKKRFELRSKLNVLWI